MSGRGGVSSRTSFSTPAVIDAALSRFEKERRRRRDEVANQSLPVRPRGASQREVRLGDHVLATPRNQHRAYRFDATDLIRAGETELVVDFAPQLDAAEEASEALGPRIYVGNGHPYNAIRKMACNFGWDWGPDLVTAGIWRQARIERWRTARLGAVRTLATVVDGVGHVDVHADVIRDTRARLTLRVTCEGRSTEADVGDGETWVSLDIPGPAP